MKTALIVVSALTVILGLAATTAAQPPLVDEDAAIDIVNSLPHIEELRVATPEVRVVFLIEERPEETGRWAVKALTDQGTHYSNVGIFYIDATTARVTMMDPLTGEEVALEE